MPCDVAKRNKHPIFILKCMENTEALYNKIIKQYHKYATTKAGQKRDTARIKYEKLLQEWSILPESERSIYSFS
jgi:hypothetical protein